jgi:hypothetical protein
VEYFDDESPRKDFWLAFKVSSFERLTQMQNGLLYMNSLDYFSNLPGEDLLPLRSDELESVWGTWRAGPNAKGVGKLSMRIGDSKDEIDLGPESVITARFTQAKNYMLFCMGAFTDLDMNNEASGETEGNLVVDEKFGGFGTHVLFIEKPSEFGNRISKALSGNEGVFGTDFTHDGLGLITYKDLANYSGPKGLYVKDEQYSWQKELRLAFCVDSHLLNKRGAYELNIGDISDISRICTVQSLIDNPLNFKKRKYRVVDGKPILVEY